MAKTELSPEKKLKLLQRLDRHRSWHNTQQRRLCLGCGKIISGSEIKVTRSALGLLRLQCPTAECHAGPIDWVEPDGRG